MARRTLLRGLALAALAAPPGLLWANPPCDPAPPCPDVTCPAPAARVVVEMPPPEVIFQQAPSPIYRAPGGGGSCGLLHRLIGKGHCHEPALAAPAAPASATTTTQTTTYLMFAPALAYAPAMMMAPAPQAMLMAPAPQAAPPAMMMVPAPQAAPPAMMMAAPPAAPPQAMVVAAPQAAPPAMAVSCAPPAAPPQAMVVAAPPAAPPQQIMLVAAPPQAAPPAAMAPPCGAGLPQGGLPQSGLPQSALPGGGGNPVAAMAAQRAYIQAEMQGRLDAAQEEYRKLNSQMSFMSAMFPGPGATPPGAALPGAAPPAAAPAAGLPPGPAAGVSARDADMRPLLEKMVGCIETLKQRVDEIDEAQKKKNK